MKQDPGTEGMTGVDIYGSSPKSSSSRCKRMTECKHAEQDPSALTRGLFPVLIYACKMALFLAKRSPEACRYKDR